jgi:hypothetical protein
MKNCKFFPDLVLHYNNPKDMCILEIMVINDRSTNFWGTLEEKNRFP